MVFGMGLAMEFHPDTHDLEIDMRMYKNINDEIPATAMKRKRQPAAIPPVTFPEALDISKSGIWPPPRTILLTGVTVTARLRGTSNAELIIWRLDAPEQPTALASITLEAKSVRAIMSDEGHKLNPNVSPFAINTEDKPIISPFEPIFVSSEKSAGHEGVVVQLIGVYL